MGVSFDPNERLRLFGGVHKGFTAPTNAPGVNEERALNYELGLRANGEGWHGELTGFWSDYDNLLGDVHRIARRGSYEVGDASTRMPATRCGVEGVE